MKTPCLSLFLLGAPRIEQDSIPLNLDTRKAVALIAYLAITRTDHRRETLAALLWPEYDQSHAMGALRRTLSALRKAMRTNCLEIRRESVALNPDIALWVDVNLFLESIAACQTHGHADNVVCPACMQSLNQALKLYRDHFMAGFTLRDSLEFDNWQTLQSELLKRELNGVLQRLVQGYLAQKDYHRAIEIAQRQLALDPLDEPMHRQLMRLYSWSGQRNAALRQYLECARILEKELGVTLLEETVELYQAIREQRLDEPTETSRISPGPLPGVQATTRIPMVGRNRELDCLHKAYAQVGQDGYLAVIEGEAGVGKTRLAEEFLERVRARGGTVLSARCYSGQSDLAYEPLVEALREAIGRNVRADWQKDIRPAWLREMARLLPELGRSHADLLSDGTFPDDVGAQTRLYEAISQLVQAFCAHQPPGVLWVEDLHWADEGTIDLLAYLTRRLHGRPIFILVTWCHNDLPTGHRLFHILAEAQRNGLAARITLTRLSVEAVTELVANAAHGAGTSTNDLAARLYRESEGLPFFVVEYLAALGGEGAVQSEEAWLIPANVREALRARLDGVGDAGRQLLQTAAVIGRSFDFDTLREVSGRTEEETASTLEVLLAHGLIQEIQPRAGGSAAADWRALTYDFSHGKIRSLVYTESSLARRRLLHRRVAHSLIANAHNRYELHAVAGQIAYHFRQSGRTQEAAEYYKLAGDHAREVHANAEALTSFAAALALGHPDPASLNESLGDLHLLLGDFHTAQQNYANAAAYFSDDLVSLGRIEHKLAELFTRMGAWEQAENHFRNAGQALRGANDAASLSRLFADWSRSLLRQGSPEGARQMAAQSLALAEEAKDVHALSQACNVIGILARRQGLLPEAILQLQRSLTIAEASNNTSGRIAALNNLSLVHAENGELDLAIEFASQALALCTELGDRQREAALHNNLADLHHISGNQEQALLHLNQAVSIFAEIGAGEDEDLRPEIWKLTEW